MSAGPCGRKWNEQCLLKDISSTKRTLHFDERCTAFAMCHLALLSLPREHNLTKTCCAKFKSAEISGTIPFRALRHSCDTSHRFTPQLVFMTFGLKSLQRMSPGWSLHHLPPPLVRMDELRWEKRRWGRTNWEMKSSWCRHGNQPPDHQLPPNILLLLSVPPALEMSFQASRRRFAVILIWSVHAHQPSAPMVGRFSLAVFGA